MDPISLTVAIASLVFSLYVFFAHDRMLNAQQKLLNELALKKAAQEDEASKKADIFLAHEREGSRDKLVVTNIGQATAFEIRLASQVDNDPVKMLDSPPHWASLKPGQKVCRTIPLVRSVAMQVTYDISWRDDLGEHTSQQMVDYH